MGGVGALTAFGVDALVAEVAAEVGVAGAGVTEQVPDDDEDGAAGGDDGFLAAAAAGDPPVALAGEGAGPGCSGDGLAEDAGEIPVAVPSGPAVFLRPGGFLDPGCELRPGGQVAGGGEPVPLENTIPV